MANDDAFRTAVHDDRAAAGEDVLADAAAGAAAQGPDSPTADIANMGERMGGGLVAGLFLREFVGEGITWAHLDIAGPGLQRGRAVRLHPQGRHRLRRPHPGARSPSRPRPATCAESAGGRAGRARRLAPGAEVGDGA